jgi:hypothetical protein
MDNISLDQFATEDFAITNREAFDAFVDYLVDGVHQQIAFVRLFGEDQQSHVKCELMLHNPYVQREVKRKKTEAKPEEQWTIMDSIVHWKSFVKNPYFKDSTRVAALKELQVIMGITEIDDQGRTRKVPTLNDLYPDPVDSSTE